ncbi:MAG TPA: hypothetical protein VGX49_00930 [Jatrophihabitans sp.]|jgi:hypothetical protein|nr:hypothetical protein [Jatrophihabitans sp.]
MPRESVRSLRAAVLGVGALGALSLSVPASLWISPSRVFPALQPVGQTVQTATAFDANGRQLANPARLRPGSSTQIVVTGFSAQEPVLLRRPGDARTVSGGRADQQGVFRYRFTAPATTSGVQSLTVIGSLDQAGLPPSRAVFRFVVSADQAGR